jgi:uncharacterized protein (TIGR02588 family)
MTSEKHRAAPLEWLAAAIGLVVFAGLFGTIFAQGLERDPAAVPDLLIEDLRVVPATAGSLVQFTVRNRSSVTAAAVQIEGTLAGPDGQEMSATATVDYVPARSKVTAGLIFPGDVRGRQVEIRPVGYRRP